MIIPPNNPIRNPLAAGVPGGPPVASTASPETLPVDPAVDRLSLTAMAERELPVGTVADKARQARGKEPVARQPASTARTTSGAARDQDRTVKQEAKTIEPTIALSQEEMEKRAMERFQLLERARSTLPKPFQDQEAAMERVLAEGKGTFTNRAGVRQEVTIAKAGDKPSYEVTIGSHSFEVTLAQDLDPKTHLARLVDFYTGIPEHLRGSLETVKLETMQSPTDAYWAKVYGRDTFMSAATAGGGAITFWGLKERPHNLAESTFNHEMGHLIGGKISDSRKEHATMIPPGWEAAAQADGKKVSDYAGMNPDEDFAETWEEFLAAQKDPEKLKAFQEKYPHRTKILEVIHQRREDPDKVKLSEVKKDIQQMLKNEGKKDD